MSDSIHAYAEVHQGESLPDVRGKSFYNELFSDCRLKNVAGAVFKGCVLHGTKVEASDIRELLGVTLSLDCHTFDGLDLSPEAFDAFLYLLTMTAGNDAARAKVTEAIDPARLRLYKRLFPRTE